jgi:hypothetical protein
VEKHTTRSTKYPFLVHIIKFSQCLIRGAKELKPNTDDLIKCHH